MLCCHCCCFCFCRNIADYCTTMLLMPLLLLSDIVLDRIISWLLLLFIDLVVCYCVHCTLAGLLPLLLLSPSPLSLLAMPQHWQCHYCWCFHHHNHCRQLIVAFLQLFCFLKFWIVMVIAILNMLLPLLLLLLPLLLPSPQCFWCHRFFCLLFSSRLLLLPLPVPSLSLPSLPVTGWLLLLFIIFLIYYCTLAKAAATAYSCCCCLMLLVVPQCRQCHCRCHLPLLSQVLAASWLLISVYVAAAVISVLALLLLLQSFLSWLFFCCQYFAVTDFCLLHDDLANATYATTMTAGQWLLLWLLPCCCHYLCHSLLAAAMFPMFLVACCCTCCCILADCNAVLMPGPPVDSWSLFLSKKDSLHNCSAAADAAFAVRFIVLHCTVSTTPLLSCCLLFLTSSHRRHRRCCCRHCCRCCCHGCHRCQPWKWNFSFYPSWTCTGFCILLL